MGEEEQLKNNTKTTIIQHKSNQQVSKTHKKVYCTNVTTVTPASNTFKVNIGIKNTTVKQRELKNIC